jgi:hypothetical protein
LNASNLVTRARTPLLALACALLLAAPLTAAAAPAKARRAPAPKQTAAKKPGPAATPAEPAASSSRRLEDVRIEGELEVPRITFITVRQPHRFTDYTRATSVRSSRGLAAETALPAWIPPAPNTSQEARKESPK